MLTLWFPLPLYPFSLSENHPPTQQYPPPPTATMADIDVDAVLAKLSISEKVDLLSGTSPPPISPTQKPPIS